MIRQKIKETTVNLALRILVHPDEFSSCRHAGDRAIRQISSNSQSLPAPPTPPCRRVVVTGIGLVTPLGVGVDKVWSRLIAGDTAVRGLRDTDLPREHRSAFEHLPSQVIACVDRDELYSVPWFPSNRDAKRDAPFMTFALVAAAEALRDARFDQLDLPSKVKENTAVVIGAGMSCTTDMAEAGVAISAGRLRRVSPFFVPRTLVNMAAGLVSMTYGFKGPNHAASTACASGAHGIGDAFRMVQRGDADVAVAGGTESCVDAVALNGFSRLKALSTKFNATPSKASRPFDRDRDGFVLSEGAGILILESLEHALARKAPRIYAEVRGYGMSADAFHITQPSADGQGAAFAMERALLSAGVTPSQVAYINAHATSTPIGDEVEQRAIMSVFGSACDDSKSNTDLEEKKSCHFPLVSSSKGSIGHLLGAAGAVEAAFTVLASYYRIAPPNVNLEVPDPALVPGLVRGDKAVPFDDDDDTRRRNTTARPAVVCNSFGFGGTNASLVFGPPPPPPTPPEIS